MARRKLPITPAPTPAITPAPTYPITPGPAPTQLYPSPPPPPATPFEASSETGDCSGLVVRDQQVAVVLQGHVGRLVQLYYDMGPRGEAWEEAPAEELEAQRQLLAAKPMMRLTVPHLRQILLAWDRWVEARPAAADLYCPSAMHLGLFLQGEARRGPTVASSRMRGLKWLNNHSGLPFLVRS